MAICFWGFAEADKGAARWYCKDLGEAYSFIDDLIEPDDNVKTIVIRENSLNCKTARFLKEKAEDNEKHNYIYISDKDIENLYSDMMNQRDLAIKPVSDKITPSLFFEYHIVSCQRDGFIITGIEESDDKTERYLTAFHKDTHRTLFIAFSMDGHYISDTTIEEKGKDSFSKRCAEYSEHYCKSLVENIRLDDAFDDIDDLPLELANIKSEADKALTAFDAYYYGECESDWIRMDVLKAIEDLYEDRWKAIADEHRNPVTLNIINTNKIKNRPLFQNKLADVIDFVCESGGKVVINNMGRVVSGYATLYKRIDSYEKDLVLRVNPYGNA